MVRFAAVDAGAEVLSGGVEELGSFANAIRRHGGDFGDYLEHRIKLAFTQARAEDEQGFQYSLRL